MDVDWGFLAEGIGNRLPAGAVPVWYGSAGRRGDNDFLGVGPQGYRDLQDFSMFHTTCACGREVNISCKVGAWFGDRARRQAFAALKGKIKGKGKGGALQFSDTADSRRQDDGATSASSKVSILDGWTPGVMCF